MPYDVEYTDEFGDWWDSLSVAEQLAVRNGVLLLEAHGPALGRPHVDTLIGSTFPNMKELRVQQAGRPYRVLFAFDPRRSAILLLGGDKTGNARWYDENIPKADAIYAQHLRELQEE